MRAIKSRSFYCDKIGSRVTLVEFTRPGRGASGACGILSCTHQDLCAREGEREGELVFQWDTCPACASPGRDREPAPPCDEE